MDIDPELNAMNEVYSSLKELDKEARQRVIGWVVSRFALTQPRQNSTGADSGQGEGSGEASKDLASYESVADVFSRIDARTKPQRVLVVAAYRQEKKGAAELTGREINKELHHLGHGVKNITTALTSLMKKRPQLIIQTRKGGKSKQAQKKYRVTGEGFSAARKMLGESNSA